MALSPPPPMSQSKRVFLLRAEHPGCSSEKAVLHFLFASKLYGLALDVFGSSVSR
jgi:hypothetical protein